MKNIKRIMAYALVCTITFTSLPFNSYAVTDSPDTEDQYIYEAGPSEEMSDGNIDMPDSDTLLEGYIETQILEETGDVSSLEGYETVIETATEYDTVEPLMSDRGDTLNNPVLAGCYNKLKSGIVKVASGEEGSTAFPVKVSEMGLEKTYFTKEELGLESLTTINGEGKTVFTDEAKAKAVKLMRAQVALSAPTSTSTDYSLYTEAEINAMNEEYTHNRYVILYSLLADLPYELYWFDKTAGWKPKVSWSFSGGSSKIDLANSNILFQMTPGADFKDTTADNDYTCDTALTLAASQVVPRAKAIAEEADATYTYDYDKLLFFKNKIQNDLAPNYNSDAIYDDEHYGNPWQLIWVFDEDPDTNVVCEGYSKAFKLLCDLAHFRYEDFDCYLISGYYNKLNNGHMWNSVAMDDGHNYMIDITNSRNGSMTKFMKGVTTGDDQWLTCGGSKYKYKDPTTYVFSEDELAMSANDYIGALQITLAKEDNTYTYTGLAVNPEVADVVNTMDGHSLITAGETYQLKYTDNDNINIGDHGIYADMDDRDIDANVAPFTITPATLSDLCDIPESLTLEPAESGFKTGLQLYNKNLPDTPLKENVDYTVTYPADYSLGTYDMTITGIGNYTGTTHCIGRMVIPSGPVEVSLKDGEAGITSYTYSGSAITPDVTVTNPSTGATLIKGTDYTVSYSDNINAGKGKIIVTGKGSYSSKSTYEFTISPLDIANGKIHSESALILQLKDGEGLTVDPELMFNGKKLVKDTDYTLKIFAEGNTGSPLDAVTAAGAYTICVYGKGNFDPATHREIALTVLPAKTSPEEKDPVSISTLKIKAIASQKYSETDGVANAITPDVVITNPATKAKLISKAEAQKGSEPDRYDYSVTYSNNTSVGTGYATVTGNRAAGYSGTVSIPFKITGTSIKNAKVYGLNKLTAQESGYTGSKVTLTSLLDSKIYLKVSGRQLSLYDPNTGKGDYTVTYDNNKNAGTATVYFTGKNGYTNTLKKTFRITPANIAGLYSDSRIKVTVAGYRLGATDYAPKAVYMKGGAKPSVLVELTDGSGNTVKTLQESVDYTLSYTKNKKITGKTDASVTVKGLGNYKGSIIASFEVITSSLENDVELYAPDIAVAPGKEKKGNYKSTVTLTGNDGKKLTLKTDYTIAYYKAVEASAADFMLYHDNKGTYLYNADPGKGCINPLYLKTLEKNDTVSAGAKIYVIAKAAANSANYTSAAGDTGLLYGRTIFGYDVLDTPNDISKGIFKISAQEYTGLPVYLDAADFTDAKLSKTATAKLKYGSVNAATGTYDADCDFIITGYTSNVKKGTAKVTLRGVNGCSGTKTVSFKIGAGLFVW